MDWMDFNRDGEVDSDGLEIRYGSKTYLLMTDDAVQLYELYEMLH